MYIYVEDKRPLRRLSSKRLEDNWQSLILSSTKQRLSGVRLPVGRKWLTLLVFCPQQYICRNSWEECSSGLCCSLAFARYWYYQKCVVYSIHTGGRKGSRILSNNRATVLEQGGQCRWTGGMTGWLIRAQQPRRKRISCKGQVAASVLLKG